MGGSRLEYGKEEEEAAATMASCREVGDGRYIEEICDVTSNPCCCRVVITATTGSTFPIYLAHPPIATKASPLFHLRCQPDLYLQNIGWR